MLPAGRSCAGTIRPCVTFAPDGAKESAVAKIELLMNKAEITVDINPTVGCQPAQGRGDRHAGSCH